MLVLRRYLSSSVRLSGVAFGSTAGLLASGHRGNAVCCRTNQWVRFGELLASAPRQRAERARRSARAGLCFRSQCPRPFRLKQRSGEAVQGLAVASSDDPLRPAGPTTCSRAVLSASRTEMHDPSVVTNRELLRCERRPVPAEA